MQKIVIALVTCILFSSALTAQKTTLVGINFTAETSGNHFRPGFGVMIEHKFTKKAVLKPGCITEIIHGLILIFFKTAPVRDWSHIQLY